MRPAFAMTETVPVPVPRLMPVGTSQLTSCFLHHQEATGVLDRKMGNVEKTGAGILATECPACMMHLSYGVRRRGLPVQVQHVSQILDQAYAAATSS